MAVQREAKPPWSAVPKPIKDAVDRRLGSPVVRARRAFGGYGPSATFQLSLADGRRAFFKGIYPLPAGSPVIWELEAEQRVYRRLGAVIRPWAPEYLGTVRHAGWHAILLEQVDGKSLLPWTQRGARRAARSYAAFHAATLDRPMPRWLPRTQHRGFARYWSEITRDREAVSRLATLGGQRRTEARAWLRSNVEVLVAAERSLWAAPRPYALLHFDTRSDNVRLEDDLLRIFDWPFACLGPAEFDVAAFAQAIEAEGGPAAEAVVRWYEEVLPLRHDILVGSVAGLAGYFADRGPRPEVPELPRLRSIQRRQLVASLRWAARLLELSDPAWLTPSSG